MDCNGKGCANNSAITKEKCHMCKGTGNCPICEGKGKYPFRTETKVWYEVKTAIILKEIKKDGKEIVESMYLQKIKPKNILKHQLYLVLNGNE
jgi:hypothetical protein